MDASTYSHEQLRIGIWKHCLLVDRLIDESLRKLVAFRRRGGASVGGR